ncbi:uncharacterized protein SETTUDRAFT_169604 [Exserohilum turcica Et28A]|uniref:Uncharacterized protein n=1 Tax=Exserohilum turcicum (strain 28A) TaxID=671987 RepID=R0IL83_EXST2|nr:uncharacterized protein SETTUDRAFT_169604 [Exserohilum turcica Et28A]EOA85830.1 hypothetical protein SETTUDRAFT_169604 [Exserohilum turcica Et28A]
MSTNQAAVKEAHVVQGRVIWLPVEEDLPQGAVQRVNGRCVDEGIYGHPVVVVSRPAEDSHTVHFQIITSRQRKPLGNMYNRSNFHLGRRNTYLPIASPDANSKKAAKELQTLRLKNGARLQWGTHVNIRHVYKIDWSLLKAYTNPETPDTKQFRFDRESRKRLLAKTMALAHYEPGSQHRMRALRALERRRAIFQSASEKQRPMLRRALTDSMLASQCIVRRAHTRRLLVSEDRPMRSGARLPNLKNKSTTTQTSEVQSDTAVGTKRPSPVVRTMRHPLDFLLGRVTAGFKVSKATNEPPQRREKSHIWTNAKGALAVLVASI